MDVLMSEATRTYAAFVAGKEFSHTEPMLADAAQAVAWIVRKATATEVDHVTLTETDGIVTVDLWNALDILDRRFELTSDNARVVADMLMVHLPKLPAAA